MSQLSQLEELDYEVPPLEDITGDVSRLQINSGKKAQAPVIQKSESSHSTQAPQNQDSAKTSSLNNNSKSLNSKPVALNSLEKHLSTPAKSSSSSTAFGFQKGFLLGPTSNSSNKSVKASQSSSKTPSTPNKSSTNGSEGASVTSTEPDIPYIRRAPAAQRPDPLRLEEVQQKMQQAKGLLDQTDKWLTNDFLERVESDDFLGRMMAAPDTPQILSEFQKDPGVAMRKYSHRADIMRMFREFCGMLGDNFAKVAAHDEASAAAGGAGGPAAAGGGGSPK